MQPTCEQNLDCSSCASLDDCVWCSSLEECVPTSELMMKDCRGIVYDSPCLESYVPGYKFDLKPCNGTIFTAFTEEIIRYTSPYTNNFKFFNS